jgi:hypothetical protein
MDAEFRVNYCRNCHRQTYRAHYCSYDCAIEHERKPVEAPPLKDNQENEQLTDQVGSEA